jgi:hypothetical protein
VEGVGLNIAANIGVKIGGKEEIKGQGTKNANKMQAVLKRWQTVEIKRAASE